MEKKTKYFDYSLLFLVIFLVGFGLLMLYSASAYEGQTQFHNPTFYLRKQLQATAVGAVLMVIMILFPYHWWKNLSLPVYLLSILLLFAVLFQGTDSNGSTRWLEIGPISFQPSETAKIAVILLTAAIVSEAPNAMKKPGKVAVILAIMCPPILLIAYSNLSSAIIVAGILIAMLFVASPRYWYFLAIAGIGGAAAFFMTVFVGYRGNRLQGWLHPESDADSTFQPLQSLYAIGSGGLFGKGLGGSVQKFGKVPEAQNDYIFSIICEELGLFGAICVILLFVLIIWRFLVIANNAPDLFGALLVVGVTAHIAIQVVLNLAVATNLIPSTGVTLPFISYGGTAQMLLLAEIGLVLSVSREIRFDALHPAE